VNSKRPARAPGEGFTVTVPGAPGPDEFRAVEARLIATFSPPLEPDDVHVHFTDAVAMFRDARIRTYLAVLIERAATDRLRAACNTPRAATPTPTREIPVPVIDRPVLVGGG
jgi:hypothetical protein